MKKSYVAILFASCLSFAHAGDVTADGVRTLTDTTVTVASEAELGADVTKVVLDNATLTFNLSADVTLAKTYEAKNGGCLGVVAGRTATVSAANFFKPNLGQAFGKAGAGTLRISGTAGAVNAPTTFTVYEGMLRLNSADTFGGHTSPPNFAVKVMEGAAWHNGTSHGIIGHVELTGATFRSENFAPYNNQWADTSFKRGVTAKASMTPSKLYAANWFYLCQPTAGEADADNLDCVFDVEEGAELYVYGELRSNSLKSRLIKRGGGTLHLMAKGAWTGGTTLEAGKIVLGHPQALGTATVTLAGDVEIAAAAGVTATVPTLAGAGAITVSGTGGLTFPANVPSTISGAANRTADAYNPFDGSTLKVTCGVTDLNVPAGQTVTLADVVEATPGAAALTADIRKTGAGTLVLAKGLKGKYRTLIAAEGVVEFANETCFGTTGLSIPGGVTVAGGTVRPTATMAFSNSGPLRFTFTGANNGIDLPAGVEFEVNSNCFYCSNATITKTGAGALKIVSTLRPPNAKVSGARWVIDEGRLYSTGGGTFGGHADNLPMTIEVHENGIFELAGSAHQPIGKLVLRGGTVRQRIAQVSSTSWRIEGGGEQWIGFAFNGGIEVQPSETPSRIVARACHTAHADKPLAVDVAEGAVLEVDTSLYRGWKANSNEGRSDSGLLKTGKGTLRLLRPLSVRGPVDIRDGVVELKEGGYIDPNAPVRVANDAKLILNDGTRFVSSAVMTPAVLAQADVWIDATQVTAANGATLNTIANLGRAGGQFAKFPTAVANGVIPNAPTFVKSGIGGKASFGFDGQQALMIDTTRYTGDNCEVFAVGMWTKFEATAGKGQWGGLVSCGHKSMTGNEDQNNRGVLSGFFSGSGTTINSIPVIFGSKEDGSTANRTSAQLNPTGNLANNEPFVLRMRRMKTSGDGQLWCSDGKSRTASSGYSIQPTACDIDRICIGSRLMTGGCATTYASGSSATRNMIGDLGELLVFYRALTDDEREAVCDYLRRKWIGTSAAVPASVAKTITGAVTVETPEGASAAFAASLAGDAQGNTLTVTKTGAGELQVGGGAEDTALDIAVAEGTIRLRDAQLPSRVPVWIDADDAATCLTDADGRVTNLVNKGFCGGSFGVANSYGKVPHVPMRTANGINNRATLTFDGESAMMLASYTNKTARRSFSLYSVIRRNQWKLHPGASNGGGYGKWATPYTFVAMSGGQDEAVDGTFHVDDNVEASSYADIGKDATGTITHPGTGNAAIFVAHMTTNAYFMAYEKKETSVTSIPRVIDSNKNLEPMNVERVVLGARVGSTNARVHYYGADNTGNRCWYGDLAELIVTTEPLSLEEEYELFAYLRKKWLDKGDGSATAPVWLSGQPGAPQFGEKTSLAMADGTALVHEAGKVRVGSLDLTGTVDWTRIWSGIAEDLPLFQADKASFGTAINLSLQPLAQAGTLLSYTSKQGESNWMVFDGATVTKGVKVSTRDTSCELGRVSLTIFIR